jgi:hypothetical protein
VVKEEDSKSSGVPPRRFESYYCRFGSNFCGIPNDPFFGGIFLFVESHVLVGEECQNVSDELSFISFTTQLDCWIGRSNYKTIIVQADGKAVNVLLGCQASWSRFDRTCTLITSFGIRGHSNAILASSISLVHATLSRTTVIVKLYNCLKLSIDRPSGRFGARFYVKSEIRDWHEVILISCLNSAQVSPHYKCSLPSPCSLSTLFLLVVSIHLHLHNCA